MRDAELQEMFEKYGKVTEARVATDRDTGRPKGFAFVTMSDARDAADAIKELSGVDMEGRPLKIEYANPDRKRTERSRNPGICYDFQKGVCSRGDSCRFSHSTGDGSDYNDRRDYRGGGGRDAGYGRDDRVGRDDRGGRDRSRDRDGGRDRDRNYGRDRDDYDDRRGRDDRRGGRDERDRSRDRDRRY